MTVVAGLSGLALLATFAGQGWSEDTKPRAADRTKKEVVEKPTARIVTESAPASSTNDNPKIKPGDVRWHASFADACKAAEKSGKPVLLFQLMGKLDDQFC
jgi:hypothetical protein